MHIRKVWCLYIIVSHLCNTVTPAVIRLRLFFLIYRIFETLIVVVTSMCGDTAIKTHSVSYTTISKRMHLCFGNGTINITKCHIHKIQVTPHGAEKCCEKLLNLNGRRNSHKFIPYDETRKCEQAMNELYNQIMKLSTDTFKTR